MLAKIENLREVARRCLEGEALDDQLSTWLGVSLQSFLERRATTIEDAFGLHAPQGGVPWWMEAAIRERDAALRDYAERFLPGCSVSAQAREIRIQALRYGATAWRFDRTREAMPPQYRDGPRACLWRAYRSGAAMPIGERQLRTILGR